MSVRGTKSVRHLRAGPTKPGECSELGHQTMAVVSIYISFTSCQMCITVCILWFMFYVSFVDPDRQYPHLWRGAYGHDKDMYSSLFLCTLLLFSLFLRLIVFFCFLFLLCIGKAYARAPRPPKLIMFTGSANHECIHFLHFSMM